MPNTEMKDEWWFKGYLAMANGVEEQLGWCDRDGLKQYTEWMVAESRRRTLEKVREIVEKEKINSQDSCQEDSCGRIWKNGKYEYGIEYSCGRCTDGFDRILSLLSPPNPSDQT